jgi:mevalonate kinase
LCGRQFAECDYQWNADATDAAQHPWHPRFIGIIIRFVLLPGQNCDNTMYPSKLLLFGEYILLLGARALAAPLPLFSGKWAQADPTQTNTRREHLLDLAHSPVLEDIPGLDAEAFRRDIADGLYFQSDIPVGYGLGSSGALCAAVYDRYTRDKSEDLSELKALFARMESHFHGQSSGIDPLTSYLNKPLLIANRHEVRLFEAKPWREPPPVTFLLDTGQPRQTGPLVQWFLDKSREPDFARPLEQILLPAHEDMLDAWQTGNATAFWEALHRVSAFQLAFMLPMIPEYQRPVWDRLLTDGDISFKICGAGGGGFMLGFAKSRAIVLEKLSDFTLVFPPPLP